MGDITSAKLELLHTLRRKIKLTENDLEEQLLKFEHMVETARSLESQLSEPPREVWLFKYFGRRWIK